MQTNFSNPLRQRSSNGGEIYPYYAGFSEAFVVDAMVWMGTQEGGILDPWLGAGTTTRAAKGLGVSSIGFDLNPAMVLVSKAEQLDQESARILNPLARKIVAYAESIRPLSERSSLEIFFGKETAQWISATALAIWLHLVDTEPPARESLGLQNVSPLPALFFVGLFNVARLLLSPLSTSNPTWIKKPPHPDHKILIPKVEIRRIFAREIQRLADLVILRPSRVNTDVVTSISVADSRNLPLHDHSVKGVITSPPYCTRLDYGRATMPELLILESIGLACYENSRLSLMGAAVTRDDVVNSPNPDWGATCQTLLEKIYNHPSKASKTYYYRLHCSYFDDMAKSISEISRVIEKSGKACVVVQDSYYKEIHNDLPRIFTEMANIFGLNKVGECVYKKQRSMCRINSASSVYRSSRIPLEVALLFQKG